jgi:hypothetical protein
MSATDLVLREKLQSIRRALLKAPKHLRPTPTCVSLPEAARRMGVSVRELRRRMARRRWRAASIDGVLLIPSSMVDMLR